MEPLFSSPDRPADFRCDGSRVTIDDLDRLWARRLRVEIAPAVWSRVDAAAARVAALAAQEQPVYGVNTGFGWLKNKRIPRDQLGPLQANLILSHAVGVGSPAPSEIVRWMLWFKIISLCQGASGVSRGVVEALVGLVNADVLPVVPTQGSLGASGDLAPLAHLVLPLLGRGEVRVQGECRSGADGLSAAGLKPVDLCPKDGLALINGTQFMSAYAAGCVVRARRLAKYADIAAAAALEAAKGSVKPFLEGLHALRPHRGAVEVAANMRRLMAGSEILPSHASCDRVQDPYSLRCVPQVHGASRDAIRHAVEVVETEVNSVTDNPVLLDDGQVVSGGLFHGQPLALALDYLAIALAELASISERRTYLLLTGIGDLPPLLMKDTGVNSGFMILQYTSAALVSENKGLCTPASVDSIVTSLGQEDHVSMGARAAVKCWQVLENAETVLAIELLGAAQGMEFHAPLRAGIGPRAAHESLRKSIPFATADREFGRDIQSALQVLRSGQVTRAVEQQVGDLL